MNLKRSLIFGVVVGVALILPTSALAANTTSLVTGTVGTELSISAATPAVMTLTHATAGTTNQVVTVISTQASWTLSIADNNTGTNAGHMLKTAGTGSATTGSPLNLALGWGTSSGGPFNNLTGSAATVGTGSLVGTKTVYLQQALNELEQVTAGDTYSLTLNYTVS